MAKKPDTSAERRTRLTCIEIAAALDGVTTPEQCIKAAATIYQWVTGSDPTSAKPDLKIVK